MKWLRGIISHRPVRLLAGLLLVLVGLLTVVEGACYVTFRNAKSIPEGPLLEILRGVYNHNRRIIQYDSGCAEYDPELFYRLRPGSCNFSNPEFSIRVAVNSEGLRDDEQSLNSPKIIVLGDSHSMGWGVEQSETFSGIIERYSGKRVLNAGISSFGTARESILLKRLDRSLAEVIIWQYCPNDYAENRDYVQSRGRYSPPSEADYAEVVRDVAWINGGYYPGKYLLSTLHFQVGRRLVELFGETTAPTPVGPYERPPSVEEEVEYFYRVLQMSSSLLEGMNVIVVEVEGFGRNDDEFIAALDRRLQEKEFKNFSVTAVDLSGILGPDEYFKLDDHLSPAGHENIAAEILRVMQEWDC